MPKVVGIRERTAQVERVQIHVRTYGTFGDLIARVMQLRAVEGDGGVDAAIARGTQTRGPYR